MSLTDKIVYDAITILEDGQLQLRRARVILDTDGSEIARQFHRQVLAPGDDVSTLPTRIRDICRLLWTPQVVAAYKAAQSSRVSV